MKVKQGGKTLLLGGVGGLLGAGLKMLAEPALFKNSANIPKYFWVVPLGEALAGGVAGAFDKTAMAGAGLSGAAVAHFVENTGIAIAMKRNAAPAAPANAGALVMPNELPQARNAGALFGGVNLGGAGLGRMYAEAGALVMPNRR